MLSTLKKIFRRRLDLHRFDGLPQAKSIRVKDESVLEEARQSGRCEVCKTWWVRRHPHHVKSVGSGGGDERSNVLKVCFQCHGKIHLGLISRAEIAAIIEARP